MFYRELGDNIYYITTLVIIAGITIAILGLYKSSFNGYKESCLGHKIKALQKE